MSLLCALGLSIAGIAVPSCALESTPDDTQLSTAQEVALPYWKSVVFKAKYNAVSARLFPAQEESEYLPFEPNDDVVLGDPVINSCEDLEGVSFPVSCTVGALTCTCQITTTECAPNSSGGCDCGYTVNSTAYGCR